MVEKDSLHHGMCFYGPSGIGKRLMAEQVARAMLCETRTGCGECKHCLKLEHGNHPDYRVIEPDGADIKVAQIREISDNLHFRPFEGRVRVMVLDRVETFREESANAFLKSLEEPPEYVYFILICSDLKALLPTIRSRCQKISFQSLLENDKQKILMERFGKDEHMADRLARISFHQLETENDAWDVFQKDVTQILKYIKLMLDAGHAIDFFGDLLREKSELPRFLDHLTATVRELTLTANSLPSQPLFDDWRDAIDTLASRTKKEDWRAIWEQFVKLPGMRRYNLNLPLWFNTYSVSELGLLENAAQDLRRRLAR